jgi:hypothetical protein
MCEVDSAVQGVDKPETAAAVGGVILAAAFFAEDGVLGKSVA